MVLDDIKDDDDENLTRLLMDEFDDEIFDVSSKF